MGLLATAAIATPLFGFALNPGIPTAPHALVDGPIQLQVDAGAQTTETVWTEEELEQIESRQSIATIHRIFGVSTWVSMAVTAVLGAIQFRDEYGFFAAESDTPCARGDAVFESACTGVPWPHAVAAGTTAVLYATTFTLSLLMPDPVGLDPDSPRASRLALHKLLRWVHFGGVIAQAVLGATISLLDESSYGTRQALATVHMGLGVVTFAALSTAGAIMIF